jgi:hypothetical protein
MIVHLNSAPRRRLKINVAQFVQIFSRPCENPWQLKDAVTRGE